MFIKHTFLILSIFKYSQIFTFISYQIPLGKPLYSPSYFIHVAQHKL